MKPLPFREVKRKLEAAGFIEAGQTGSHLNSQKQLQAEQERRPFRSIAKSLPAHFEAFCAKPESALKTSRSFDARWRNLSWYGLTEKLRSLGINTETRQGS